MSSVQVRPSIAVLVPHVARWSKLMLLSSHRHFDYLHICLEICQTAPGSQWGSIIYFIFFSSHVSVSLVTSEPLSYEKKA